MEGNGWDDGDRGRGARWGGERQGSIKTMPSERGLTDSRPSIPTYLFPPIYSLQRPFQSPSRDHSIALTHLQTHTTHTHTQTPKMSKGMQHISASSLSDLPTRISYLRSFIEFSAADAATLHASRDVVAPLVPVVVDTVYTKLLSFDITARAFVPRQTGYAGEAPASLADLSHDHPQIRFRKDFLARYLVKLVSMDYDDISSWEYLDKVGLMHTGQAGFAHRSVPPPFTKPEQAELTQGSKKKKSEETGAQG